MKKSVWVVVPHQPGQVWAGQYDSDGGRLEVQGRPILSGEALLLSIDGDPLRVKIVQGDGPGWLVEKLNGAPVNWPYGFAAINWNTAGGFLLVQSAVPGQAHLISNGQFMPVFHGARVKMVCPVLPLGRWYVQWIEGMPINSASGAQAFVVGDNVQGVKGPPCVDVGEIGTVTTGAFGPPTGIVRVVFADGHESDFSPDALARLVKAELVPDRWPFKVGDHVRICTQRPDDPAGLWVPDMDVTCGCVGDVLAVNENGGCCVRVPSKGSAKEWWYKPEWLTLCAPVKAREEMVAALSTRRTVLLVTRPFGINAHQADCEAFVDHLRQLLPDAEVLVAPLGLSVVSC